MKTTELLAIFRGEIDDAVAPYLWSDNEVMTFMDDAQKMFCRLAGGIRDSSSALCEVDMDKGDPLTSFDPRILQIRRIQRGSDARPVRIVNVEDMDAEGIRLDNAQGRPDIAVLGLDTFTIRWVHIPAIADTATMTVDRLPLNTLSAARESLLEIEDQHQIHLMLWMKSLAYGKQDSDTYDTRKSAEYEEKFNRYCKTVAIEKAKLRHKTRTVRYAGL